MHRENKDRFKFFSLVVTLLLLLALVGVRQAAFSQNATKSPCSDCHVCPWPTAKEPCLKSCTRPEKVQAPISAHPGPDVTILGQLADMYQLVRFNHKLHADMVGMEQGCTVCHHYATSGKYLSCREWHGKKPSNPENLRQPSLKAAYHRQCLSYHREWSHQTRSTLCHLPVPGKTAVTLDSTDIIRPSHPAITPPQTKIFNTPYELGPIVTFHHQEHIDRFGLSCAHCHQKENCGNCHDIQKAVRPAKSMEEVHAVCNNCHRQDGCNKCHETKEKPKFSHAATGWPLNTYPSKLDCRACHPTGKKIARLDSSCKTCHSGWTPGNFKHAVTGLKLDEIHSQLDCVNCHTERNYSQTPNCSDCHADGRSPIDSPPGERLKIK